MMLLEHELARRADGGVQTRPSPVRVRWNLNELTTSDGHRLKGVFTASVRALDDATERRMLEEVFLSERPAVTTEDVAAQLAPALHSAADKAASARPAADWLADATKQSMIDALAAAGKAVAFTCGIELLPPFHLDLESPSFQQQKLQAMERQLAERRAAGQVQHFQRAAELLKQFQEIRAAAPELTPGRVLDRVSAADRGAMLETLLLAQASHAARDLWAVAGPYLVRIDTRPQPARLDLTPLPPELGPLRSVQPADIGGKRMLLVGARSGVMLLDPANPNAPQLYRDDQVQSQMGFSRAQVSGDELWACHGEAGVVAWKLGQTASPSTAIRPAWQAAHDGGSMDSRQSSALRDAAAREGPRHLFVLEDGRRVFAEGRRLRIDGRDASSVVAESPDEIIAVVPDGRYLITVHADGWVCRRDTRDLREVCDERRFGRLTAAGSLPWLGTVRLLLATESGPIQCAGFDDQLVTQYASTHHGLRIITGAADRVAAVSADRQRLIIWDSWDGRKPAAEVYVTGATRHRIADVDFA